MPSISSVPSTPVTAGSAVADVGAPAATVAGGKLQSPRFTGDAGLVALTQGGPVIGLGTRTDGVKHVQQALAALGFNVGTPDGIFGKGTSSAVAQFQKGVGITASGVLDGPTILALDAKARAHDGAAPATPVTPAMPATPSAPAVPLSSTRFSTDPDFKAIAAGTKALKQGDKSADVEKVQWSLVCLGYDLGPTNPDGSFGPKTAAGVKALQASAGLPQTGVVDAKTLGALDAASAKSVAALKALSAAPADKPKEFHIVVDIPKCRIYVMANGTDKPVAEYETSPGQPAYPTLGDHFQLQSTTVMGAWHPPAGSAWAAGAQVVPPGINNPMGICKLSFGFDAEYFHGIPPTEEGELGTAASHGCCRMSGSNILELHELYAGPGTDVVINRDATRSAALASQFSSAGVQTRPTTAGRQYTAAYLYGEMGQNEVLQKDGSIKVGGRGG